MLEFHIIIINFSIFTNKNSQSDTFFPKLKNTIVKIDIKSFSVYASYMYLKILLQCRNFMMNFIKILLQIGSFKINFTEIQLIFV